MRSKENIKTLPVSALVASFNEGHLLEDCLKSIQFCDEIAVLSLQCDDNTEEIANKHGDVFYYEDSKPMYCEIFFEKYIPKLKNDWFLLIDPDERLSEGLVESIRKTLETVPDDISMIRIPMINHFKGKPLKGTVYGGIIYARLLYRFSGVTIGSEVHAGIQMKPAYSRIKIKYEGNNFDTHYWCESWRQLLDKHKRYLKGEGMAQYNLGNRYSLKKQWYDSIIRFYYSFKTREGYKDGLTGLLLSFLAARYEFLKYRELRKYQNSQR